MKSLIMISIFAIFIQGCASQYTRSNFMGGYRETQLDENVFKVTFEGNGFTGQERASDLALLRCAELTLEKGYNYFAIVDANSYTANSTYTTPTTSSTTGSAHVYGNQVYGGSTTTTTGGQTYNISKPSSSNTIVCFIQKPDAGFSYNADFIYKSLTEKYGIKKTSK